MKKKKPIIYIDNPSNSERNIYNGLENAVVWQKPDEWDSKLTRKFLQTETLLLKPSTSYEEYFYQYNPKEPLKFKAPNDVSPQASCIDEVVEMKNYANCPDFLRSVVPDYYGIKVNMGKKYLCLRNLMNGMKNPAICDIKLGTRSYDPFATEEKIKSTKNFSKREEFGFRIVGMRIWADKDKVMKNKHLWGRSLEKWKEQIEGEFAKKFVSQMTNVQKSNLLSELKKIFKIWKEFGSKELLLFSSSMLIVYDAAAAVGNVNGSDDNYVHDKIFVKLIDFNHSFYKKDHPNVDDGFLLGIRNIRKAFLNVLKGSQSF